MVMYDITNEASFDVVRDSWMKEINNHAPVGVQLMLVGNKCDLDHCRVPQFDYLFVYDHALQF